MSGRAEVLRRGTVAAAAAVVLLSVAPATAGWWEVHRADAYLDLESAREIALAAVDEDPTSHDAVAAAAWWYKNIGNLPDPLEIVRVAGDRPRDPELGFLLSRIEAPADWPPAGSLATCEIAGPFGMFEVLDLDRDVVPADRDLPPMGTPWRGLTSSYRLRIRTSSGTIGPPEAMSIGGVFRAAWTVLVGEDVDGWLVMEAQGGVNLFVDGQPVARLRACGQVDPGVTWYRAELEGGLTLPFTVFTPDESGSGLVGKIPFVPTTLLVDGKGIVERVWYGVLRDEDREELGVVMPCSGADHVVGHDDRHVFILVLKLGKRTDVRRRIQAGMIGHRRGERDGLKIIQDIADKQTKAA